MEERREGSRRRKKGGSHQLEECPAVSVPLGKGIVNRVCLLLSNACCVKEGPAAGRPQGGLGQPQAPR